MAADKIQTAQYQLDLILGFFSRVDALLAALLGLNVAMLGVAFARSPEPGAFTTLQLIVVLLYLASAVTSFYHLYRGSFPNTDGGIGSLVYFSEVAKLEPRVYVDRFKAQDENELSRDLLHQAWRNSCILSAKFSALKAAYVWLLVSIMPWGIALILWPAKEHAQ